MGRRVAECRCVEPGVRRAGIPRRAHLSRRRGDCRRSDTPRGAATRPAGRTRPARDRRVQDRAIASIPRPADRSRHDRPCGACECAGPTVRSSCSISSAAPWHRQAMSSQTCTHARRARRRRQQRVERRNAPRVRRRNVQTRAHVVEARLADPADARLQRLQRRQEQVPLLARLAPAGRGMRVASISARSAVPRRAGRSEQRIHRGTLVVGRRGVPQVQVHQSSPAAAKGSCARARRTRGTRPNRARRAPRTP